MKTMISDLSDRIAAIDRAAAAELLHFGKLFGVR